MENNTDIHLIFSMERVHKKDITTGLRPLFIVLVNAGVYSHLIAGGSYAKTVSDVK